MRMGREADLRVPVGRDHAPEFHVRFPDDGVGPVVRHDALATRTAAPVVRQADRNIDPRQPRRRSDGSFRRLRRRLRRGNGSFVDRGAVRRAKQHIAAAVERLGAVAPLPDEIENVPAFPSGQRETERVMGRRREIHVGNRAGIVHQLEVVPGQRIHQGIETLAGQVETEVLRGMGRGGKEFNGVEPVGVGNHRPGRPIPRLVERRVLLPRRATQPTIGNQFAMASCGVPDVDLHPVVQGLGLGRPGLGTHRVVEVMEATGGRTRWRLLQGTVRTGRRRRRKRREQSNRKNREAPRTVCGRAPFRVRTLHDVSSAQSKRRNSPALSL